MEILHLYPSPNLIPYPNSNIDSHHHAHCFRYAYTNGDLYSHSHVHAYGNRYQYFQSNAYRASLHGCDLRV